MTVATHYRRLSPDAILMNSKVCMDYILSFKFHMKIDFEWTHLAKIMGQKSWKLISVQMPTDNTENGLTGQKSRNRRIFESDFHLPKKNYLESRVEKVNKAHSLMG